eukprot:1182091-Prorocentrum_minimum.AAC.4
MAPTRPLNSYAMLYGIGPLLRRWRVVSQVITGFEEAVLGMNVGAAASKLESQRFSLGLIGRLIGYTLTLIYTCQSLIG